MKTIHFASLVLLLLLSHSLCAQTCQTTNIPATTPTSRFTVNANGTVTDRQTGLMWKRCSEGQSGSSCAAGSLDAYNWQAALQHVQEVNQNGYAGFKDWRLPNVKELRSIVERQCYAPAINAAVFPYTGFGSYWSSSPVAHDSSNAWVVTFGYGNEDWYDKGYSDYVRLVRSGQ